MISEDASVKFQMLLSVSIFLFLFDSNYFTKYIFKMLSLYTLHQVVFISLIRDLYLKKCFNYAMFAEYCMIVVA